MNGRRFSALVGLLLTAGVLAGCSSSGTGASDSGTAASGGEARAADVPNGPGAAPAPAQPKPAQPKPAQQQQVSQPGVDRKLIRTANLELVASDVGDLTKRAREIAVGLGGFTGQEDVHQDNAMITLQVPSTQFDKALGQLADLVPKGKVRSSSTSAEDVTEQLVDVESRIATQRASVDRVRALMDRAQSVADVVSLEGEVTRREADLESLEKRREALSGQVALSKITLRVSLDTAPAPARQDDSGGILGGLSGGWHAFLTAGGAVLRVLAAMLPFLVVFGIPGLFAVRWWRRRSLAAARQKA